MTFYLDSSVVDVYLFGLNREPQRYPDVVALFEAQLNKLYLTDQSLTQITILLTIIDMTTLPQPFNNVNKGAISPLSTRLPA